MTESYDSSTECITYTFDITDDDVRQIVESGSKLKIIDEFNNVCYPVNMMAKNATPALHLIETIARVTIIDRGGTPLMLEAMNNDAIPRYLKATLCPM